MAPNCKFKIILTFCNQMSKYWHCLVHTSAKISFNYVHYIFLSLPNKHLSPKTVSSCQEICSEFTFCHVLVLFDIGGFCHNVPETTLKNNTLRWRQHGPHFQTFSNEFFWIKIYDFWLRFYWNLFPRVQLRIFHHWLRWQLSAGQATSHYLNQWWLVYWRINASLNELNNMNS